MSSQPASSATPPKGKALTTAPKPGALQSIEGWNPDQITLIKNTVAKGVTDDELRLFLYVCKHTGLDPLVRQIHARKQWDGLLQKEVMIMITGIDGYRLTAHRTKEMDGEEGPFWCGDDGIWKDVWLTSEPPVAAKVIVHRKGHTHPYIGIARFEAYAQRKKGGEINSMWSKMPDGQLAKCAEALALRKAFPNELGGTHAEEELQHTENDPPNFQKPQTTDAPRPAPAPAPAAGPAQAPAAAAPAPSNATPVDAEIVDDRGDAQDDDVMDIDITPKMVTVSNQGVGIYNVTDVNGVVRPTKNVGVAKTCKAGIGKALKAQVRYIQGQAAEILSIK